MAMNVLPKPTVDSLTSLQPFCPALARFLSMLIMLDFENVKHQPGLSVLPGGQIWMASWCLGTLVEPPRT